MIGNALEHFSQFKNLEHGKLFAVPSFIGSSDAFAALAVASENKIALVVTPGIPEADRIADDLDILTSSKLFQLKRFALLQFPTLIEDDKSSLGQRLKTIAAIDAWSISPYPAIVVAPFASISEKFSRSRMKKIELTLEKPEALKLSSLNELLSSAGYSRSPIVEHEGEYSIRGGIIDVWSPGEKNPIRLEFFGDTLESIRIFDSSSQISICNSENAVFLPISDSSNGEEKLSIFDIMPEDAVIFALGNTSYNLDIPKEKNFTIVSSGEIEIEGAWPIDFHSSPLPGFSELGIDEAHHPELFQASRKRLEKHIDAARRRGADILQLDELSGGFEIPGLIVETKSDRVFAKRTSSLHHRKARFDALRINDFEELEPGEYVVHVDHGVGRFVGSSEIIVDGKRNEVFTIEYEGGALLHVPAAHAHLISRYVGVKGAAVQMHRLDGKRWQHDKENANKAIHDLAVALLETQAKREITPSFAYDIYCEGIDAFEAAFPYEETADQLSAIEAVKKDMASNRPMDRLICGDAGYGKTEVAMRAAYIAAMNGRQVALLAPTTILAEQHFETFASRFDGTPIRIEVVSRFQSKNMKEGTFKRIANGSCDIVIGTHAILTNKIHFRDLGLIIIDEEQRFGVRHKEFLKSLRATADILTLSATPIPRTLYLSMTGARDLSILRTPPRERVAVETKIVRDSDEIIRSSIEAELKRAGQVYFLHNRVLTIPRVERRLRQLCPKAKLTVAHGQMNTVELSKKIREFEQGKSDILLSTTIVESGIDIPRANTILIDEADKFGLADLYQLRGRVGRSSKKGYAVLLLPQGNALDSDARERLKALQRHGGLGGGFNLALRDLEIRGAGNLLGAKQSGHIATIGFTLYCQLLQRTIAMMKGEKVKNIIDVKINLDFIDFSPAEPSSDTSASIPYSYIEEDSQRIALLKRFAEATDKKDIRNLVSEMKDRFGKLPPVTERFVKLATFKVECAAKGIARVDVKDKRAVFYSAAQGRIVLVEDISGSTPDKLLTSLSSIVKSKLSNSPSGGH